MAKVQKRYEYWSSENGKPVKKWTPWYDYSKEDSLLKDFQTKEKYQLSTHLKNEFRIA